MSEDLWGTLPGADPARPPSEILREQASLLAQKTGGRLEGAVTVADNGDGRIQAVLFLLVPVLNNYRTAILTVTYPRLTLYPADVLSFLNDMDGSVDAEEAFKGHVAGILQSDHVKKLIAALLREIQVST